MGKGRSAVLPFLLYIFTHTNIVCAVKTETDKAMVEDLRMAVEVNSEAGETIHAHNRNETSSDDVAHEVQEEGDENSNTRRVGCTRCMQAIMAGQPCYPPCQQWEGL